MHGWTRQICPPLRFSLIRIVFCIGAVFALGNTLRAQERYLLEDGQWTKESTLDPESPEGRLQDIRRLLAEGHSKKARKAADQWIEANPQHPLVAEAYLLRGDARTARGDYFKALYDYEYLVRTYPASEHFLTALQREYEIASLFASGTKRKLWGLRIVGASGEAEELFIRIQERAPGSEVGENASLSLGDFYFDRSQMTSAAEAYDLFLANYPESQYRQRAMHQQIVANLATFKGPRFDSTGLIDASQRLKTYRQEFPAAAQQFEGTLVRIEQSLALKTFYSAQWYETRNQPVSAITMYQRVVSDHPQTAAAHLALERLEALGAPAVGPGERDKGTEGLGDQGTEGLRGRSRGGDERVDTEPPRGTRSHAPRRFGRSTA